VCRIVSAAASAVFLTALELEHGAVAGHITGPTTERVERGLIFDVGTFAGRLVWNVAVAQVGPGNVAAGVLLERAVAALSPDVVMFVGIAGGRKDVRHGDVVAADAVYDYESGKEGSAGYLPRIKTAAPSFPLVQRARAVARRDRWQHRIRPRPPRPRPSAFVQPVAAGGKVVAADRSGTADLLSRYCGDALAVDMESFGFLHGAYLNGGIASLVVRGISDLLADKTAENDRTWQVPAARNAAAFAFEVLDAIESPGDRAPEAEHWRQVNSPAKGGVVYASQGSGNQIVHPSGGERGSR
jgi:nucleoside phosphorylase